MKKTIYFTSIAIIAVVMVACAKNKDSNMSQTGLVDQNGNVITNTLIYTNTIYITNNQYKTDIPIWATNQKFFLITTNADGSIKIDYGSDTILVPNIPDKPTDYYRIYVPFGVSGDGYTTVSYKDTNKLKQLWLDQINRRGLNDGYVFAIRNRGNNRDYIFQARHKHENYSAQDYYYFNDNGDIVWKEDNKVIKKFVGAIITEYRYVEKKQFGAENPLGIVKYTWNRKNVYTVGGIYANTLTTEQAREQYFGLTKAEADSGDKRFDASVGDPFKAGVFDFVAAREKREVNWSVSGIKNLLYERQYINPGFIEVLVMNPDDNMGYSGAAGVYSYYAYFGKYTRTTPFEDTPGFQSWNMLYMTNQNIYLGERPEHTIPLLTHSTAFTDGDRYWQYLFMPGIKY